jgi:nucleotide-binding universal stress UspA family protein
MVGYDGSAQADKAVGVALSLAESLDCTVLIFAVARPPEPATSVEVEAVLDDAREHYQAAFKKILEVQGREVNLIVLGRRGMSLFEKWLARFRIGAVLRYAHCPVRVVR